MKPYFIGFLTLVLVIANLWLFSIAFSWMSQPSDFGLIEGIILLALIVATDVMGISRLVKLARKTIEKKRGKN